MEMKNRFGAIVRRAGLAALLSCGITGFPVQAQLLPQLPQLPQVVPVPQLPALPVPVPSLDSPIPVPDLGLFGSLLQIPALALPSLPTLPLFGSLLNLGNVLDLTLLQASGELVLPTPGTESLNGTIFHGGQTRRYTLVRPATAPAGAPVLLLLHASGMKAARMANLTRAGRLAADYGAWVYLPEANGQNWNDDPSRPGTDDVGFLDTLMSREVAAHALDAKRIYVAGYSNGGYMAARMACTGQTPFAGLAMVAATLRSNVAVLCPGGQQMPTAMFNGTSDAITPYGGLLTLSSVENAIAFWAVKNGCAPNYSDVQLPNIEPLDGTTVTLRRYPGCVGSDVRLYRVNGGGHTWPGTSYAGYTAALGATTFDVDATIELWKVLIPFAHP